MDPTDAHRYVKNVTRGECTSGPRNLPNTCMCAYLTRLLPEPSFFTRLRRLPQPPSNLAKIQHKEKGAQKQRNQVREGAFSQRPRLSCLPPPSPPLQATDSSSQRPCLPPLPTSIARWGTICPSHIPHISLPCARCTHDFRLLSTYL
ncbi:unnamed protein product [Ectocarpus sp. 8 AP-2014]